MKTYGQNNAAQKKSAASNETASKTSSAATNSSLSSSIQNGARMTAQRKENQAIQRKGNDKKKQK